MVAYAVEELQEVTLDIAGPDGRLAHHDLMSPFVWTEGPVYRLLVRVLPNPLGPADPTGVIWAGESDNGTCFRMQDSAAIVPGPNPDDAGGCEDPTVVRGEDGAYLVFYTGVDAARSQGALLVAKGPKLTALHEQRVMLKAPRGEGNIKEATLAQGSDGRFRLFYEYARDDASRIGMAVGPTAEGPWTVVDDPFSIREDAWDNWHLSTGPIVQQQGRDPVMFYNGATADARWRIGWISFSPDFGRVTGRGIEPIVMPPPAKSRDATDIAFAASCLVMGEDIWLYYSLEDRILRRARIRRYGR
ncbi:MULTISPECIES: glycosidase [unclassified Sphingomonas]|uniref:glycosidase n=1 Tax=unclassified Sphingomonas TaxID=196159 RepID=UPI0006FD0552|nr:MULTISPECIES: glycosidase [unclassified Sphingomonas]KQX25527.1 glycosidase [Sphingomonas sp. Root1294]KQY66517.1 glycosidase [Sphingomonas sp. Root50]KRB90161.1 glycosidase [Sphingomonas sp. Root720]